MSYYHWLLETVASKSMSSKYSKLLADLYAMDFEIVNNMDSNRAEDGVNLRYRYGDGHNYMDVLDILEMPCTILEMLVAFSLRIKNNLFDSYRYNANDIFWEMIQNLGLSDMTNARYDSDVVADAIDILVNRDYEYDGSNGGLFQVPDPRRDMRDTELWYQMSWYYSDRIMKGDIT